MGGYWRFTWAPHVLEPESFDLLRSIPGVRLPKGDHPTSLAAPENCAWLAAEILGSICPNHRIITPRSFTPRTAKAALPYLREWVPAFLTPYQREGIKRVLEIPGESGAYHWSAGSGKTLGAIIWALTSGPQLTVVVTKAAIRPTWTREIETYTRGVEWASIEGMIPGNASGHGSKPLNELFAINYCPRIIVTGYDTLPAWIPIIEKLKPTSVIFDEIHKVKNWKRWNAEVAEGEGASVPDGPVVLAEEAPLEPKVSFSLKDNQAAACYRLSRVAKRRLGTTATPIKDRVRDLWAQLDLIHPWEWGGFYVWAKRYAGATENVFGGIDTRGKSNLDELKKRLSFVSHRVPYSVANRDLPPKRRLITYIKVSDQDRPLGGIAAELKSAGRHGPHALLEARLMEAASRKRKIVLAHCRDALEASLKVVVFTGRRVDCDRLAADAAKWKTNGGQQVDGTFAGSAIKGLSLFSGHGGDSPEKREEIRKLYMAAPGPALLIGTGDAWGEGLDLQDTDLGIFAMLPYTPGQIIQWEGRWTRRGQKRPVLIRYFIAEGSIDEHVATILLNKLPSVEKATDSDEITGLGRELIGASEEELLNSLCSKVLGEEKEASAP